MSSKIPRTKGTHPPAAVAWPAILKPKVRRLGNQLRELGSVLIAYSGGVDSAFLAAVAHHVLGRRRCLAVTAVSASLPGHELAEARALARKLGLRHRVIHTDELANPCFTANPPDRCYHCKKELFSELHAIARREKLAFVLDGNNADDLNDYRPGRRAKEEAGVRSPLQECGWTKAEIRSASKVMGLPTATKPASPCLASRIPYGTPITGELLGAVGRLEAALRRMGFSDCRARAHGPVVRIEVPAAEMDKAWRRRAPIADAAHRSGFIYVALDLEGLRSGSLNAVLKP